MFIFRYHSDGTYHHSSQEALDLARTALAVKGIDAEARCLGPDLARLHNYVIRGKLLERGPVFIICKMRITAVSFTYHMSYTGESLTVVPGIQ